MKKVLLILVAVVVVGVVAILAPRLVGPRGATVKAPFTIDFKPDDKNLDALVSIDDMSTLLACSPFYEGTPNLPGQRTYEFDEARAKKVNEIIDNADQLASTAIGLKSDVDEIRRALLDYLTICAKEDPRAVGFAKDAGRETIRLHTLEALVEAEYHSINTKSPNPFARTFMQYAKTAKAVELGALYLQDAETIGAFAATGLDGMSGTKNAQIVQANARLDAAMAKIDNMSGRLGDVMSGMRKVDYGFKQLKTGDYYFACTAVQFMRDSMPALKLASQKIKPGPHMDARTVAYTRAYLAKFDNFSVGFRAYLESVPRTQLLPVASRTNAPDCAFADNRASGYDSAVLSVSTPVQDTGAAKPGWLAAGWNGLKTVVHGTQSAAGVFIDAAGIAVRNMTRVGAGIYYGNTTKEIWTDMQNNSNEIFTNWKNNQSGAATLHTANEYINSIDDGAEYIASKGVEQIPFGGGWPSWGIGKVARATAGLLTGLGKGITLVANRDAETSDYVIGAIEIAGSVIGGSKLVIKGSMVPEFLKGLGEGTWISARGAWNTAQGVIPALDQLGLPFLKWHAEREGLETLGLEVRQAANQAVLDALAQSNQALKAELTTLVESGLKAGWANFNGTLRESLSDFAKKEFTTNLKSLASMFGENWKDYADNVMASWAEDAIKALVDQAMAEAPLPQELKGLWTGTTVFTSIQVPQAAAEKASKEGCNIGAAIKKLEGKPLSTTLRVETALKGSGRATIQMAYQGKGSPFALHYAYNAGAMTIHQDIKGGTLSMKGEAKRMTQGYSMNGSISLVGGGNGTLITMSGRFDLTKPH